jgi:hypothetical protein
VEESESWSNIRHCPRTFLEELKISIKYFKLVGVVAEIRTEHFPNIDQNSYLLRNFLDCPLSARMFRMLNEFPCSLVLETYRNIEKYSLLGCDDLLNVTDVSEEHTSSIFRAKE